MVIDHIGEMRDMKNDLISRASAIDIVRFECGEWEGLAKTIIKRFEQLPSVQSERKKGRWLTSDDMYETGVCSVCKCDSQEPVSYTIMMFKYCPNCGAEMENDDD